MGQKMQRKGNLKKKFEANVHFSQIFLSCRFVPAEVLDTQHTENAIFGDKADDAAYRREYVHLIVLSDVLFLPN